MSSPFRLLAVDDDSTVLDALKMFIPSNWEITTVSDYRKLPSGSAYDAAFVDLHLGASMVEAEGVDVIRRLRRNNPHLEIVAMSGDLDRDLMEETLKAGATRFLGKPLGPEEVDLTLGKIEAFRLLQRAQTRNSNVNVTPWIGESEGSTSVQRQIADLTGEDGPILIEGETGTGKEVAARLIHNSQDPERPFVPVNVATLPENLFESELFGHVKGSFTGAEQNKMGLIEVANGGDLFLDEVEALPVSLQAKLLRFLESGELRRVGARESFHVNVRVIAATNQPLTQLVSEGNFREDLLWRLSGRKLVLPPLRERKSDIDLLAPFFLEMERPRRNKTFSKEAILELKEYDWPGNVRELRRVCEQLSLISPLPIIRGEDAQLVLHKAPSPGINQEIDLSLGLSRLVSDYESRIIQDSLAKEKNIDKVAQLLQVSRSNLYKKIKEFGLNTKGM